MAILGFPVLFWILLTRGHNNFKTLEYFGPVEVTSSGDSIYHTIPNFSFTDENGIQLSSDDLKGKIYIANFFFASCPGVCPKMNEQVKRIQYALQTDQYFANHKNEFEIISHSIDPENDSVSVLKAYSLKMGADSTIWHFVTAPYDSMKSVSQKGYFATADRNPADPDGISHSQNLFLIDKEKHIRAIRDGMDRHDVDTLIDEMKVLLLEYKERERKK